MSSYKNKIFFNLSLTFSLILILSNLVATSRLIVTPYFTIPGGLLFYPLTFVISNIVNEIFGPEKTRYMVFSAFTGNILCLIFLQIVSLLPASSLEIANAWHILFDISPIAFIASFTAFSISQQLDITSFHFFKRNCPKLSPWIRNNASSMLSQMVDTLIVDLGVVYIGMHLSFTKTLQIMTCSYLYKVFFSLATTPIFYMGVRRISRIYKDSIKTKHETLV
ncbi:queuosine precursor transporter [Chlamydia crocodili]|uniref:Probable queuosine precursor transporter n=1 Tax=Chlamydia crocodili TaxID=2766982 RepID=A0ABX8CE15_9CHLA|nr:queuosine precursor transporter [Chlamydia crocodili]QVE49243.1 queuosine precursor transporter [Chlamydia crocodili]